jgi:hypothetical protein
MANSNPQTRRISGKMLTLLVLGVVCGWLVYRNLLRAPSAALPPLRIPNAQATSDAPGGGASAAAKQGRRTVDRNRGNLSNLDPTLRLDLLEAARAVEYSGSSRNIFEAYVPPPPPAPPPPAEIEPPAPVEPPPPRSPLKFYGTTEGPGRPRRAFLIDGEENIFIAREGEIVAAFYKITRIGVASLEMEDTRTQQTLQLPLEE